MANKANNATSVGTATKGAKNGGKVREPESIVEKKAAKAVAGKTKGEGKAVQVAKDAKSKGPKGPTIGAVALKHLEAGKSAKETLALVLKQFPEAKTSMACIYWYANKNGIVLQKAAAVKEVQTPKPSTKAPEKKAAKTASPAAPAAQTTQAPAAKPAKVSATKPSA